MEPLSPSDSPTFASSTPLHIGQIELVARDLAAMTRFYGDVLGLRLLSQTTASAVLGAGGVPLVNLIHRPDAVPDDPREAGLFHTAFLMPTRAHLARWLIAAARRRVPLTGMSDHAVSEAIYLDDPEGNGVEVYADRPRESWTWDGDQIHLTTDPLDVEALLRAAGEADTYAGAPAGLRIGHVHLRVGEVEMAESFYHGLLGLEVMARYRPSATFLSSGGYHHHIAGNVWSSRGAGPRDDRRAGLSWFSLAAAERSQAVTLRDRLADAGIPVRDIETGFETCDPWGTRVRVTTS